VAFPAKSKSAQDAAFGLGRAEDAPLHGRTQRSGHDMSCPYMAGREHSKSRSLPTFGMTGEKSRCGSIAGER